MTDTAPIACTLDTQDFKRRIAWISELNGKALMSTVRNDLTLELNYRSEYRADVLKMVRGEQECCGFLSFQVSESGDNVRVAISASEDAREAAEMIFDQFLAKASSCGCAKPRGRKKTVLAAMALSGAAVACGACCALPVAGVAVVGSLLAWLARIFC